MDCNSWGLGMGVEKVGTQRIVIECLLKMVWVFGYNSSIVISPLKMNWVSSSSKPSCSKPYSPSSSYEAWIKSSSVAVAPSISGLKVNLIQKIKKGQSFGPPPFSY